MPGPMSKTTPDQAKADLAALRRQLDEVCTRDYGRLSGRWRKLSRTRQADTVSRDALRADIEASFAVRQARVAAKPALTLDAELPISARADDIVQLIRHHQVIVVAGETGSGKTTQLPKLCLAAGCGEAGLIGCTQPRRLAARSVARRVAEEMGTTVGDKVGFQVRFSEQVSDASLVKFMTDGILLAETQSDPWLSAYDTLIIDEAHERSLNIDFLLGYLKQLVKRRRNLKLIITSATIDTARFAEHFDGAPVVEVEGRTYPVEVRWRPGEDRELAQGSPEHIARAVDELTADAPRGDILVFLPGEREIRDTHLHLSRRQYRHTEILPLYARLSAKDQDRVFKPGPARRIVLATNVAETSLTVPRIHAVIDTGTARVMRYSQRSQIERLHVEPVSQAAADQRKGRCGRVGPGICIRLYGEEDYAARPRFTDPELLRSSLANVILRMLSLRLGDVEDFPFLDMPEPRAIGDGYRRLAEVQAIDDDRRLTALGRELARLPIDVQLARMLIESVRQDAVAQMLVLVAFLSVQDPRERPPETRQQADAAHREFADPQSDFIGVLNLWRSWTEAHDELTQSKLRDWCKKHFVGYLRMREWREVHRQLKLAMKAGPGARDPGPVERRLRGDSLRTKGSAASKGRNGEKLSLGKSATGTTASHNKSAVAVKKSGPGSRVPGPDTEYEAIHLSLLSGLPTQVGHKDEHGIFRGTRERKFQVFPGSALAKKPPAWVFAAQILDIGGKVWGMQCARVEPAWIERQAAHLLRRSWHDPHWSRKRGAVVAFEQVTLFGMVLVERRPVTFRKQDPALAHQVFVREALARGEIDARADFVRANQRVLDEARDIEARQRRQGLIRPDEELAAFYEGKLPTDISDSRALDAWYRKASPAERAALRWTLADVMAGDESLDAGAFPPALELGGQRYRLSYRFVPGDAADGVSLHLPMALLNALPDAPCQWLVPGLLADKAAELIRGLPKSLRRNFVPAPDFARAFVETGPSREQPLLPSLAAFLVRTTGVIVTTDDFAVAELPAHLCMRFVLEDDKGKQLASGRDLATLRSQWEGQARAAFSRQAAVDITRENVTAWDFDDIPARIVTPGKPDAFPALVDLGESVALRVFERNADAREAHLDGVRRLLRLDLEKVFKQAQRKLPMGKKTALQYVPLGTLESLREDLVEGGFSDLLAERDLMVRHTQAFETLRGEIADKLFAAAVERLKLAEPIIATQAEVRRGFEPLRPGQSPANYADLHEQIESLLAPGFLRDIPSTRLRHYPRYLDAMRLRAERLHRDPGKDHRHLHQVLPYWRAYLEKAATGDHSEALDRLRWLIEEYRVSLFAQELKTAEPVSPKRLKNALDALRQT
ncbi:MAG TPA: ATP-dependent RNA helicase HrpA [Oleiagrimonas sp.]|nr:ATP-dependent RNA helicase HrpA [Oleiagrimonas sp.]